MCSLFMQIWQLTPGAQKEVDAALRDLKKLERPTIAFHVRGGDAIGDDDELLFSVRPQSRRLSLGGLTCMLCWAEVRNSVHSLTAVLYL